MMFPPSKHYVPYSDEKIRTSLAYVPFEKRTVLQLRILSDDAFDTLPCSLGYTGVIVTTFHARVVRT